MAGVTAYFDLDGTLLDASSEKSLTALLSKRRPWRIPLGATMWSLGFIGNLLRARSVYDAARNRGHLALCNWETLRQLSSELVESKLSSRVTLEALERLEWHREQGHRLVLVTATVMPMAQAMADYLAMDAVYGCGPENMTGIMSGSERGWSVPRRKGKVPNRGKCKHQRGRPSFYKAWIPSWKRVRSGDCHRRWNRVGSFKDIAQR